MLGVDETLEDDEALALVPVCPPNFTVSALGDPLALSEFRQVVVVRHWWDSGRCNHVENRSQEVVVVDGSAFSLRRDRGRRRRRSHAGALVHDLGRA